MERLKSMKTSLMSAVEGQMGNLQHADTKELGEAIDMIKDLSEAIYYCTITEAMAEKDKEYQQPYPQQINYYTEYPRTRDMDYNQGRMYYSPSGSQSSSSQRNYSEKEYPMEMRDYREGRSPMVRRMYMESKQTHQDKANQMRELEKYMQELSSDVTEMVEGASPEEKQLLEKKLNILAAKIGQMK